MNTATFETYENAPFKKFSNPALIERDLQFLKGLIQGINGDSVINDIEYSELTNWINSKKEYENKQPYHSIIHALREAISDKYLTVDEIENIIWFCDQYLNRTDYFDSITLGIQELLGVIKGIVIDKKINDKELSYLDNWLEENQYLKNTWPFDELYNVVTAILSDQVVTEEEKQSLFDFCSGIVGLNSDNKSISTTSLLKTGYYQIDPEIILQENTFCITGVSNKYKRKEIAEKIELYGGYVVNNVSSKLNYLIVCDEKNACWAFTCYGRKIEEAIRHRKNGAPLIIVHEYDLYDVIEM